MKSTVLTLALALGTGLALAETAKTPASTTKAKPANAQAAKAQPAKAQPKKVAAQPRDKALNAAALAAHSPSSEAALGAAELAIAERVHVGSLPCELGNTVHLTADAHRPGYFDLQMAKTRYRLAPVATSTGAIRLEDSKSGAVWLQLANKSMLMNHKVGQRMADECKSPQQTAVAEQFKIQPPPSVLDATPSAPDATVVAQPAGAR